MISYILALLSGLLLLGADQYTKAYIVSEFQLAEQREFLDGFIDLVYIHNQGGAWGLLQGHTWMLLAVTIAVMFVCVAMLLKFGFKNKLMFWAISLVMFGGIGNMIDRIFRDGNVVDFLHFEFMPDFPVFNVADCGIVIGAGLLILYFVLDMIKESRQKKTEEKIKEQSNKDGNN
ncbi:MAG: signal peptidase II [Clostridia bacterium]|nr:signal peptidase II [Clostridia bacterium]